MKEISELNFPDDIRYAEDHEWIRSEGGVVRIGITDYAQDQLGDIVFVDLPEAGEKFKQGDEFGTVESVNAVSELYLPIGGEIVNLNPELEDAPELVNTAPYTGGWMIEVKPDDPAEVDALMDQAGYLAMLKG